MRDSTIARNYAETLLELARRAGDLSGWGTMIGGVADAMEQNRTMRLFLESPRVSATDKKELLGKALGTSVPRNFLRYLQSLVSHRRQMLIPGIAAEYMTLVDEVEGRLHARVTVARETTDAERAAITQQLSRMFAKDVVPHITVDPAIMGGIVVNVGDTVLDGSVRKRLATLRRKMLTTS
ncbi:MAG: F0F1 ATP synthase subunit delta [Gemmatimonadaceae bacterium]